VNLGGRIDRVAALPAVGKQEGDSSGNALVRQLRNTLGLMSVRVSLMEAYVTAVYGRHVEIACAAAVLGRQLTRLDRTRRRIALVHDISPTMEEILQRANWTVQAVTEITGHEFGALPHVAHAIKLAVLALRAERLLYFDVDHVPYHPANRSQLERLWKLPMTGSIAALASFNEACNARPCFNSGLMLIRPSQDAYHMLVHQTLNESAHSPRLCPAAPGTDQPVLNRVFKDFTRIPPQLWNVVDEWVLRTCFRERRSVCDAFGPTGVMRLNSFHFFHNKTRVPWKVTLPECRTASGNHTAALSCSNNLLAGFHDANHQTRTIRDCLVLGLVVGQWWDMYRELPSELKDACAVPLGLAAS